MSFTSIEQTSIDQAEQSRLSTKILLETQLGRTIMNDFINEQGDEPDISVESIDTLLERYEKPTSDGWLVTFHELPEGITAYNASKVFKIGEKTHMLVREEDKGASGEFTSRLAIYECSEDGRDCYPTTISSLSELTEGKIAQDPAIAYVKDKWVVTWVEVKPKDLGDPEQGSTFNSVTAIGDTLDGLELLVESDENTKGLRYVELLDGRIGVTTRTTKNGEYKMCFALADDWKDITTEFLVSANEIEGLEGLIVNNVNESLGRRWIGPNDMELLANGDVSMLFHTARFVENGIPYNREYDVAHCVLTYVPENNSTQARYPKIIARATDFNIPVKVLPPKRPNLEFVAYPSWLGISTRRGGKATLLAALRDAGEVGQEIPDPLKEWRANNPEFADNPFPQSAYRQTLAA